MSSYVALGHLHDMQCLEAFLDLWRPLPSDHYGWDYRLSLTGVTWRGRSGSKREPIQFFLGFHSANRIWEVCAWTVPVPLDPQVCEVAGKRGVSRGLLCTFSLDNSMPVTDLEVHNISSATWHLVGLFSPFFSSGFPVLTQRPCASPHLLYYGLLAALLPNPFLVPSPILFILAFIRNYIHFSTFTTRSLKDWR